MNWLKKMLVTFLIKYVASYAKEGLKKMADTKSTSGMKSSEFWLGLLGVILTYLNTVLEWNMPTESILSIVGIILGYIFSRTILKTKSRV